MLWHNKYKSLPVRLIETGSTSQLQKVMTITNLVKIIVWLKSRIRCWFFEETIWWFLLLPPTLCFSGNPVDQTAMIRGFFWSWQSSLTGGNKVETRPRRFENSKTGSSSVRQNPNQLFKITTRPVPQYHFFLLTLLPISAVSADFFLRYWWYHTYINTNTNTLFKTLTVIWLLRLTSELHYS